MGPENKQKSDLPVFTLFIEEALLPECIPTPGKNDSAVPCITRSYLHHVLHLLTLGQKIADTADYMPIDATQLLVLRSPDNFDAASLWTPDFPRQEEI
jgi:hypothetical protein